MTRTKRVLEAGRVCHDEESGWVEDGLGEVEQAFERFLLALDDRTFEALLASLEKQTS